MADHPRRGRNRPDSRAMWEESERRSNYGANTRDRRDNRDRFRDEQPRNQDRRQRSRSRSPIGERRERHRSRSRDRRDRDRDYGRDKRRGYDGARDKIDGREREKEMGRDGRRREDNREEHTIPKGPARRGDARRSISPQRSPPAKTGRAAHDPNSPLPTRSKHPDRDSGHSSARGDLDDEVPSRKRRSGKKKGKQASLGDGELQDRGQPRGGDGGDDPMDEDDSLAVEEDDEMSAMQAMMGFGGFGTTKGQKVAGNNTGAVYKAKKTEYRQYMNRVGGFNRPLSPGR